MIVFVAIILASEIIKIDIKTLQAGPVAIFITFALASGIPIGFLIYQIYFFIRWQTFWKSTPYEVLKEDVNIIKPENWKVHFREDWLFVENNFYGLLFLNDNNNNSNYLLNRYNHLLTVFHGLGASSLAIVLGVFSAFITLQIVGRGVNGYSCVVSFIFLLLAWVTYINRKYAERNTNSFLHYSFKILISQYENSKNKN